MRTAELVLERQPPDRLRVHRRIERLTLRTSERLRAEHGDVGVAQQIVRIAIAAVAKRDADAGRGVDFVSVDLERLASDICSRSAIVVAACVANAFEEDGKLVAAEPRERISGLRCL